MASKKSWDISASLVARRETILASIAEQGKLTDELKARIEATFDKSELEDLYLPYRPKRRTKATMAREKGLEPLALYLWAQEPAAEPLESFAATFVNAEKGVTTVEEALEGARHIVAEMDQRRCRPAQGAAADDARRGRGGEHQGRPMPWMSRKSSRCTTSIASR